MKSILIDAGPIVALFDKDDNYHIKIKRFMQTVSQKLVTTWPVVTETCHMLNFNVNVQIDFMKWLDRNAVSIFNIRQEHLERIISMSEKYKDIPMDFADATLMIAGEDLGIKEIISIDSDYDIYRTLKKGHIKNVFEK